MSATATATLTRSPHLTFKGNLKGTRYGWLRLTPAFSIHLVSQLLTDHLTQESVVLDPFCGTGTTALVCAEHGTICDTTDINPFLVWLTKAKTQVYSDESLTAFEHSAKAVASKLAHRRLPHVWVPSLHQIEKWWDPQILHALGRIMWGIRALSDHVPPAAIDLLKIAFCRTMINQANVSFGHQSMSFKQGNGLLEPELFPLGDGAVTQDWVRSCSVIGTSARSLILRRPRALLCDARSLTQKLKTDYYTCIITSPPYPNRMSYIRELRPYMYWLGFLDNGRDAGELDWQTIGGTWGCATSNLTKWEPAHPTRIPFRGFMDILDGIAAHSPLLSRYVYKYFCDMVVHCNELYKVTAPGGFIHYIVGNSKFYDVVLPVESIYASLFKASGFVNVRVQTIRKRSSKKELFEYVVSGMKR